MAILTTDGSRADVAAKIASAVDGDTVTLPEGSFAWSSGVSISGKGIKLQGEGGGRIEGSSTSSITIGTGSKSFTIRSGSTITGFTPGEAITVRHKHDAGNTMTGTVTSWNGTTLVLDIDSVEGSGTHTAWVFEMPADTTLTHNAGSASLITVDRDASHHTELSGFRIENGTGTGYAITSDGDYSDKKTLIHDLRISNVHQGIRDIANGCVIWRYYADAGFNIGGDITNNDNAIIATDPSSGETPWNEADTVGSNDTDGLSNLYIEDCYFFGLVLGAVDCGDNFRGVVRHCVFDNSAITIHGQDTDPVGMRHLEVYDNELIFDALPEPSDETANLNYWVTWRGGSGIFTDNVVDNITSWAWGNKNEITMEYQPLRRDAGPNSCYAGAYPAPHQPGQGHDGVEAILEGVWIWNNTGTVVVEPVDYSPDECSGGQSIDDFLQLDRDFFLEEPTAATPFFPYEKFTYPHPLREGDEEPEPDIGTTLTCATLRIG